MLLFTLNSALFLHFISIHLETKNEEILKKKFPFPRQKLFFPFALKQWFKNCNFKCFLALKYCLRIVLAYLHNVFFLIFANENFAVHGILLKIYPIYIHVHQCVHFQKSQNVGINKSTLCTVLFYALFYIWLRITYCLHTVFLIYL